ncbi:MAG: hypothetical protein E7295_10210 [Lachnospiraceae bacterium]|nr:hypothetical protein [Lachnospiraceae bacterium]
MRRRGRNLSTAELIGISEMLDEGYVKDSGERCAVFLVRPSNLSVLSEEGITAREEGFAAALKGLPDLSVTCLDSSEGYAENKRFLRKRMGEERNPAVRRLLEEDLRHLDELQLRMATAREFLITVRPRDKGEGEILASLGRIEKMLEERGMAVRLATREDLKRILAVYFEQNVTAEKLDDVDGERWVVPCEG